MDAAQFHSQMNGVDGFWTGCARHLGFCVKKRRSCVVAVCQGWCVVEGDCGREFLVEAYFAFVQRRSSAGASPCCGSECYLENDSCDSLSLSRFKEKTESKYA